MILRKGQNIKYFINLKIVYNNNDLYKVKIKIFETYMFKYN
jgi:hypothetical protein